MKSLIKSINDQSFLIFYKEKNNHESIKKYYFLMNKVRY